MKWKQIYLIFIILIITIIFSSFFPKYKWLIENFDVTTPPGTTSSTTTKPTTTNPTTTKPTTTNPTTTNPTTTNPTTTNPTTTKPTTTNPTTTQPATTKPATTKPTTTKPTTTKPATTKPKTINDLDNVITLAPELYEKNIAVYPIPGTILENPFSSIKPVDTYIPFDEDKIQFSKLTGLSNSTPVYFVNDMGEGFCKYHKTNIEKWENECNHLSNDTCAATSCCVLLGGQKCVAGDKTGVKMTANYSDPWIQNRDYYYFMGKCYGKCGDKKYKFEAPLVPSSKCAPPGAKQPDHTYATPYLENERTQILPMKPNDTNAIDQDADFLFSSVNESDIIIKDPNAFPKKLSSQMQGAPPNVIKVTQHP